MTPSSTTTVTPAIDDAVFEELLLRLEPELESTSKRYRHLRTKMVKFFAWKMCRDPESLADEAITRLLKNVAAGLEILADNPYSYVYGIARNILREHVRSMVRNEQLIAEWHPVAPAEEDQPDCRNRCLASLDSDKRALLVEYYCKDEERELIAERLNLTLNALRLKVFRLKNELKTCYENCIKNL